MKNIHNLLTCFTEAPLQKTALGPPKVNDISLAADLEADVDIILLAMVVAALNAILINNWVSSENVLTKIFQVSKFTK